MDPRDLEHINELLEGEANLKEVNHVLFQEVLTNLRNVLSHRGSVSKQENLKRKRE
jgi:hypothetical protein